LAPHLDPNQFIRIRIRIWESSDPDPQHCQGEDLLLDFLKLYSNVRTKASFVLLLLLLLLDIFRRRSIFVNIHIKIDYTMPVNFFLIFSEFLDQDITQICKENNTQFDAVYLLLYYYYGGCIYTALKEYAKALYFFEVAVTCPTAAVSHVMLEAYKKYLLVGLLVHGDRTKDSGVVGLPKFTSAIVGKFLKPLCVAYNEIATAYHGSTAEELRTVVAKYQVGYLQYAGSGSSRIRNYLQDLDPQLEFRMR